MDFTPQQEEVLTAIRVTEAVVAVMASSLVVFSFARFPELRKPNFALVFWLCISDMGANLAYSPGAPADGGIGCLVQGISITFFDLASVWWTFLIGFKLYRSIVKQEVEIHTLERTFKMHAIVWGTSFVAALLPLTTHNYGDAGAWCWISAEAYDSGTGTVWRFAIFYIPIWCVALATSVHYVAIIRTLSSFASMQHFAGTAQQERLARLARQLSLYPLIFVASWTMMTIVRVYNSIAPHKPSYWLTVLQVLFSPMAMQAVLNTVAYGMGDQVRARWIQLAQDCKAQKSLMPLCCAHRSTPLAHSIHLQDDDGEEDFQDSPRDEMSGSDLTGLVGADEDGEQEVNLASTKKDLQEGLLGV